MMLHKIALTARLLLLLALALVLDYTLPRHDIARITETEVIRMDFSPVNKWFYATADRTAQKTGSRDLRLIYTVRKRSYLFGFIRSDREEIAVYRNEDTGWGWPPYFKFDSSDLQAKAASLISTEDNPKWVVITRYGWRSRLLTIYPNVLDIREAEGPDVRIIPWFNIFFFAFLLFAWLLVRAMWRNLRRGRIDPMLERAGEAWEEVDSAAERTRGRLTRWLRRR